MYSWSYSVVLLRQELEIGFSWRAGVSWLSQLYVVEAQPYDRVAGSDKLAMCLLGQSSGAETRNSDYASVQHKCFNIEANI